MSLFALVVAGHAAAAGLPAAPACTASQLSVSLDGRDGAFDGMSHAGTELSVRNLGPDCTLPGLPLVQFLDAGGNALDAHRQAPPGMHPGPAVVPVRLGGGHRAATQLRWVSGQVFDRSRELHAASIRVSFGTVTLQAQTDATMVGEAGKPAFFTQPPLRAMEGTAAD